MLFEDSQGETFLSALYLDPRFHFELTDVQKVTAQSHLKLIYNKTLCKLILITLSNL